MTEPQVWVLIGVFAAAFFTLIGSVTTNFNRTMVARFETMDARFEGFRSEMNAKFEIINIKLENMDRHIQALSSRVFGTDQH